MYAIVCTAKFVVAVDLDRRVQVWQHCKHTQVESGGGEEQQQRLVHFHVVTYGSMNM